jgi:hypothetical protein
VAANNIHPSEREDFEKELQRRGRSPEEFELSTQDPVMSGTRIQPTRGTVRVRHVKSGTERTYSYTTWVTDCIRDLDASVF